MDSNITQAQTLGLNVREARQALGWSASELAAKASIDVDVVTKLERSHVCSNGELQQISRALGIPVSILKPAAHKEENTSLPSKRLKWAPTIITAGFILLLIKLMIASLLQ